MKDKQTLAVMMIVGLILLGTGYCLGRLERPIFPNHRAMNPLNKSTKTIEIVFADSVDGRPTYTVNFPDSTLLDVMYPEEIANGLNTGHWDYDEMLTIIERP